ncbi:MAG: DUF4340 domain-containing protein [Nitrospirae bacterium]|nr:DUF4340 domain-containing protein [Nitrospirota bacterium]
MTRHWLTILMAVVLAGLGAYVYFVELPAERTKVQTATAAKKILPFEEREITAVTVRTDAGEVVLTRGEAQPWSMTAPIQTDADSREVDAMLRALAVGRVTRVVEEKAAALAPFGLEKPSVVLTVTAGTRRETLSLGDSGPISSTLYAMRDSDRQILLTDLAPKDFLNKTVQTFRKKEVLRFEQSQVDRLRLTYPTTEIVLYLVNQDEKKRWKVVFPIEAEADQAEVRGLLMMLEELKALGFIDPGPQRDALAKRLKKPGAKITVHVAGADQTVKLFQPDPASGEAYAGTTPEAPIYRINPSTIKDLTKELFALQDKRLLGVSRDEIARLVVKTREEQYVLLNRTHANIGWVLEDQPNEKLDQQAVALLVSRVADLPAELRVVKQAGPLAPYGLSSPTAEFTATGKDGKTKGRLVLGTRTGGLVYAMGQGLTGIYQARSDILTQIPAKRDLIAKAPQDKASTP